jgi:hypothetical protein
MRAAARTRDPGGESEGDAPAELQVLGFVGLSHAAGADVAEDAVVTEDAADEFRHGAAPGAERPILSRGVRAIADQRRKGSTPARRSGSSSEPA